MEIALLKESHENLFLKEGYLLGLRFYEGWACFRILGGEPSNVKPYSLGDCEKTSNLDAWDEIIDSSSRRYLEPHAQEYINQIFYGINKPKARIFFQYPSRQDRWSLLTVQRTITGAVGYVDGLMSPYDGPFSIKSQIFTVHELYPAFQCYNPLNDKMDEVMLNFDIMRYQYVILKDRDLIKDILTLKRPARLHVVGGIDPSPSSMPEWLRKLVTSDLLAYSETVLKEGG